MIQLPFSTKTPKNLRSFLNLLEKDNDLVRIRVEVDPYLEIAEIHRRVVSQNGPALLFEKVKGSRFPVVTNLFGTQRRLEHALGGDPSRFVQDAVDLIQGKLPPSLAKLWEKRALLKHMLKVGIKKRKSGPILDSVISPVDLNILPIITSWPEDGGPFITLPLVYTEPTQATQTAKPGNLGMYRIQRFDSTTTGLHFQIGKGAGFHLYQAESNKQDLPVAIFLGGPPVLTLSAIAPLPENVPELLFCSFLMGSKLEMTRYGDFIYNIPSECDFALLGHAKKGERRAEGPFGDHFGYYSLAHDFPVFHCSTLLHRNDAVFPATVVGKPPQEDLAIGNLLQKTLSPLFPVVMPGVQDLHTFSESGFHPLAAARVKERYEREALTWAMRIMGEGQLSLTKCLIVTDQNIDIRSIKTLLQTLLERMNPKTNILILGHTSNDTLDYTGQALNLGSKMILIGTGEKIRELPSAVHKALPHEIKDAKVFCPGCLVIQVDAHTDIKNILQNDSLLPWPLIIIVDNVKSCTSSSLEFLWQVFTRFEPALDVHARKSFIERSQASFEFPLLIDARMKPRYPKALEPDDSTVRLVDRRWKEYFETS